jgi:hypothetical protein
MRYTAVARSHGDVLELYVHVVLGCSLSVLVSIAHDTAKERTFDKLAAVHFSGSNLESNNVALESDQRRSHCPDVSNIQRPH